MSSEMERYLATVDCHFKWKPYEEEMMPEDIKHMEEKLVKNIEENPKIKVFALTLLSYIFTRGAIRGKARDYEKAIKYADDAKSRSTCKGEKLVAMANKMHIYLQRRKSTESGQLYLDIKESLQNLTDHDQCRIMLTHAFALSRFGIKGYPKSIDIYRKVLQIDSHNPDGHFGLGMVLGRIRRYKHSNNSKPCEEEMNALSEACKLWENKDAFSVVWFGYAKAQSLLFDNRSGNLELSDLTETAALFNTACSLADEYVGGSCIVYKWCAKGYKRLRKIHLPCDMYKTYTLKQKECVDKAVQANPTDSSALHEAGIFYWRVKRYQNFKKAKQYLLDSSACSTGGNFWADVDLTKLCGECDPTFDTVENYISYLGKYEERENGMESRYHMAYLHMSIGQDLIKQGDRKSAIKELMQAIEFDKTLQHVKQAKKSIIPMLHEELKVISDNIGGDKYAQLALLLQLGDVYYITKDLSAAKPYYEEALSVDCNNSTAKERLCEIYFKVGKYNDCIQMGCPILGELPHVKAYVAKSYYKVGEQNFDSHLSIAKEHFCKSAELGLIEAGRKLFDLIQEECRNNIGMSITKSVYEECSKIYHWYSETCEVFSTFREGEDATSSKLIEQAKELSQQAQDLVVVQQAPAHLHKDFEDQLSKIRRLRFKMTVRKISLVSTTCVEVLSEARCRLDGCFFTFKKNCPEYRDVNKRGYYPFTPKAKNLPTESEKNLQDTIEFMKKKLEDMKLGNFSSLLPDLFDFLCKRQAMYSTRYDFVPEFCRIVNEMKHESKVAEQDRYYDLAHLACHYVEELAIEFTKYMTFP